MLTILFAFLWLKTLASVGVKFSWTTSPLFLVPFIVQLLLTHTNFARLERNFYTNFTFQRLLFTGLKIENVLRDNLFFFAFHCTCSLGLLLYSFFIPFSNGMVIFDLFVNTFLLLTFVYLKMRLWIDRHYPENNSSLNWGILLTTLLMVPAEKVWVAPPSYQFPNISIRKMSTRESLRNAMRTIRENREVITGGVATAGAIGTAAYEAGSWKQRVDDRVELEKVQSEEKIKLEKVQVEREHVQVKKEIKLEKVQVEREHVQVDKDRLELEKHDQHVRDLKSLSEVAMKRLENADSNWKESKLALREYKQSAPKSRSQEVLEDLIRDEVERKVEREDAKAYSEKCTHRMEEVISEGNAPPKQGLQILIENPSSVEETASDQVRKVSTTVVDLVLDWL